MPLIVKGAALPTDKPIKSASGDIHKVVAKNGDVIWEMFTGADKRDFAFIEQKFSGNKMYGVQLGAAADAWSLGDNTTRELPISPHAKVWDAFHKGTHLAGIEFMVGQNNSIGWRLTSGRHWVKQSHTKDEGNILSLAKLFGTKGNYANPTPSDNQSINVGDIYADTSRGTEDNVYKILKLIPGVGTQPAIYQYSLWQ